VSIPSTYPSSSPPQLQLLSRYIGSYGVSSSIFGAVLRTFISTNQGVEWTSDSVCVFDGLENVKEKCGKWYEERLSETAKGETIRGLENKDPVDLDEELESVPVNPLSTSHLPPSATTLPEGIEIIEAESITDRKSVFVGRACRITDPAQVIAHVQLFLLNADHHLQVPLILAHLSSDRRIARAAHPIINAWRCQVGSVIHQGRLRKFWSPFILQPYFFLLILDNDDDGETAAGGRLAHLLQILVITNRLLRNTSCCLTLSGCTGSQ
jgi:Uncharacterized protein family UPF0029